MEFNTGAEGSCARSYTKRDNVVEALLREPINVARHLNEHGGRGVLHLAVIEPLITPPKNPS